MKKKKNLVLGISALLLMLTISGCNLKKEIFPKSNTIRIEIESDNEYKKLFNPNINDTNLETEEETSTSLPFNKTETTTSEEQEDNRKRVTLTFDDGPSKYTEQLLEVLKQYDVKATFFVIGNNCEKRSDALLKIAEDGHEIAIHGETHTSFTKLGPEETTTEIENTTEYIESLGISVSNLVRPPYGSLNNVLKENIDYPFILWNIDTKDWENKNKDLIKKEIIDNIQEGSIILMHDTTKAIFDANTEALKELLPELTKEYKFITISEMAQYYNIELENGKTYRKIKSE